MPTWNGRDFVERLCGMLALAIWDSRDKRPTGTGAAYSWRAQGTGLPVFHGSYPYVTSGDTTTAGCLADLSWLMIVEFASAHRADLLVRRLP